MGWILLLVLPLLPWLVQCAVGPALVGLLVTWAGSAMAMLARCWFRRLRVAVYPGATAVEQDRAGPPRNPSKWPFRVEGEQNRRARDCIGFR